MTVQDVICEAIRRHLKERVFVALNPGVDLAVKPDGEGWVVLVLRSNPDNLMDIGISEASFRLASTDELTASLVLAKIGHTGVQSISRCEIW